MNESIEKFIDAMNLKVEIRKVRDFRDLRNNNPGACFQVLVWGPDGKIELAQYHCYVKKMNGSLKYDESNDSKGPREGIFAYLGDDEGVSRYFEALTRKAAKDYLEND